MRFPRPLTWTRLSTREKRVIGAGALIVLLSAAYGPGVRPLIGRSLDQRRCAAAVKDGVTTCIEVLRVVGASDRGNDERGLLALP